jgi:type IV secretory pathway protease TraF
MMKTISTLVLGAIGLGLAGTALASANDLHTMKVALPDGSVALVQYHGDVAPQIQVAQPVVSVEDFWPFADMSAQMAQLEAQSRAMMAQAAAMQREAAAHPGQSVTVVSDDKAPSGFSSWTSVTTISNGKGTCTQTTSMRSDGTGKPQMTQASSGDCDAVKRDGPAVPGAVTAPVPPKAPVTPVKRPVEAAPPGTYPA